MLQIFFSLGFTSQPTISSPVIQSTTQIPGQCDFKGALQCTRTVGTDTLQRFATASFTNITEVESFCWRVYLHITKHLSFLFSNDPFKNMGVDIVDQLVLKFVLNNPVGGMEAHLSSYMQVNLLYCC